VTHFHPRWFLTLNSVLLRQHYFTIRIDNNISLRLPHARMYRVRLLALWMRRHLRVWGCPTTWTLILKVRLILLVVVVGRSYTRKTRR
jgi:hypothetical protein